MRKIFRNIALVCAVICVIIAVFLYVDEQQAGEAYEELKEAVVMQTETESETVETETSSETESQSETETYAESETAGTEMPETQGEPVEIPIDFASLQSMNPDIYAWIQVEGTVIDYPIVQHPEDNSYYLDHTVEGEEAIEGAIYTEDYNEKDFEDPNTVIYGHNMRNGSMFQGLHDFSDRSFFNENREITIYLPDEIRHYEIFAAYLYDSRHILQSFDFSNEKIFESYLNSIFSIRDMSSYVDSTVEVDTDSKIITLSTCYKGMDEKRYLVQAVLVSVEK